MPETSIVITARDNYSGVIKTLQSNTRAFSKDAEALQKRLSELDKTRATLKVDTDQARRRLTDAQKSFAGARDRVNELQGAVDNFSGDQMGDEFQTLAKQLVEANAALDSSSETMRNASREYETARRNLQVAPPTRGRELKYVDVDLDDARHESPLTRGQKLK